MIVPGYPGHVVLMEIFMAKKFGMGFFGGLILAQGFFWVLIFATIRSSMSLEIRTTPPPPGPVQQPKKNVILFNTFCFAFQHSMVTLAAFTTLQAF